MRPRCIRGPAALPEAGLQRAKAAAFGALLGMLATVVTARSVLKSGEAAARHPAGLAILPVYSGLLVKLLLVAGGAFAGLVWLQLGPLFCCSDTYNAGRLPVGGRALSEFIHRISHFIFRSLMHTT